MSKVSKIAAVAAVLPALAFATPVFAGSPGQLGGGDNYVVKNLSTQGGAYSNSVSATCNDEVQYSMQLTNTQFGSLDNVTLVASLPSQGGVSTATATTDLGGTSGTSDTATVTLSSGATQSLVSGSVVLSDSNAKVLKALPDTITSGVNIGTLAGSTTEFVNFKAKVNCPPTTPKQIQVCVIATKKIVTINENDFNSTTQTKDLTKCSETPVPPTTTTPTVLPNTGAGNVVAVVAGAVVAGAIASRLYLSRKLTRNS